jgi:hypothetical protein
LKYTLVITVCTCCEPDPMTHGTSNLDQYCTSYMLEKPQCGHVFYMYGIVFEMIRFTLLNDIQIKILIVELSIQWCMSYHVLVHNPCCMSHIQCHIYGSLQTFKG